MDAQNYSVDLWGTWNPGWEPLALTYVHYESLSMI